jgi:hypothetical protein
MGKYAIRQTYKTSNHFHPLSIFGNTSNGNRSNNKWIPAEFEEDEILNQKIPLSPRKTSQPTTGKRMDEETSSSDGLTTQATRRPAPDPPGTFGEPTPECSRQQAAIDGKPAYAAVVAGRTNPQQPNGQLYPIATGLESSEQSASPEAANRRMSVDMSGPLSSVPAGATQAEAVTAGEQPNKTPIFVTGVTDTRDFFA